MAGKSNQRRTTELAFELFTDGTALDKWVREQFETGDVNSWRQLAEAVSTRTGGKVTVSYEALRTWFPELHPDAKAAGANDPDAEVAA